MKNLSPALLDSAIEEYCNDLPTRTGVKNQPAWNYQELYELIAVKGINMSQAARMYNVTPQAIAAAVKLHDIPRPGALKTFKENRADTMAAKGMEMLYSLESSEIKSMAPGSRVVTFGILYDKERLERNQSTDNVQINQVSIIMDKLNKSQQDLTNKLAELEE